MKELIKQSAIKLLKLAGVSSKYAGAPKRCMLMKDWCAADGKAYGATYTELQPSRTVEEAPPVTLENEVHKMYTREYVREEYAIFVAAMNKGRVSGRNCAVITADDTLISDVSREFGAYGGITGQMHSINRRAYLGKCVRIDGTVAVIGTAGAYNYHHWLYDTFARIGILKMAGVFDSIDKFVIDYTGKPFQKECLSVAGIPEDKVIHSGASFDFHIEAERLIVPSLPARLGTISKWTVDFLRESFLGGNASRKEFEKLYISRRKAPTRKLLNEDEVFNWLQDHGFIEFFPEDHSIAETAKAFASAKFIVGVHGSGFANFAFLNPGAKVIDIVAPRHLDPYYWILANHTQSRYAYLFGKGSRPEEERDLVISKVDEDIETDMSELKKIYRLLEHL